MECAALVTSPLTLLTWNQPLIIFLMPSMKLASSCLLRSSNRRSASAPARGSASGLLNGDSAVGYVQLFDRQTSSGSNYVTRSVPMNPQTIRFGLSLSFNMHMITKFSLSHPFRHASSKTMTRISCFMCFGLFDLFDYSFIDLYI